MSHRVSDLAKEVERRAKGRVRFVGKRDLTVLMAAQKVGVRWRYEPTVFFMMMQQDWFDRIRNRGAIFSTVESTEWMRTFVSLAHRLINMAHDYHKRRFRAHQVGWRGHHLATREARLLNFAKAAKIQ